MYSLNQEKAVFAILERVGMISFTRVPRAMPWCASRMRASIVSLTCCCLHTFCADKSARL